MAPPGHSSLLNFSHFVKKRHVHEQGIKSLSSDLCHWEGIKPAFYPPVKGKVILVFINGAADLLVHMKHILAIWKKLQCWENTRCELKFLQHLLSVCLSTYNGTFEPCKIPTGRLQKNKILSTLQVRKWRLRVVQGLRAPKVAKPGF